MEIETKTQGTVCVEEERLIKIPEGLFGFESYTDFALVDSDYPPFVWLQSTQDKNLAFLIVDPFLICTDYELDVDDEALKKIGIESPEDILVMSIVTIPQDSNEVTANLLGPLIINRHTNVCAQVVLSDSRWTTKFRIGA